MNSCDYCAGRGYIDVYPWGTAEPSRVDRCDHCGGTGSAPTNPCVKCEDGERGDHSYEVERG